MSDRKQTAMALVAIEQLITGLREGESIEEARGLLHSMVEQSSPLQLAMLLTSVKAAAQLRLEGNLGDGELPDMPTAN